MTRVKFILSEQFLQIFCLGLTAYKMLGPFLAYNRGRLRFSAL